MPRTATPAELRAIVARVCARNRDLYASGSATPPDPREWAVRPAHETDADYFEELTFHLFAAGFSREVTRAKWPRLREAFAGFALAEVAAFDGARIEALIADRTMIRNRRKIAATVENARTVLALAAAHGSFAAWLGAWPAREIHALHRELTRRFAGVGDSAAQWFLLTCGFPYYIAGPDARRVLARLDLLAPRSGPAELCAVMLALARAARVTPWVVSAELFRFGSGFMMREAICQEVAPRCPKCPLWDHCAYFNQEQPE
jgi:3-methyladenine DNA glycosylase Tag